MRMSTNLTQNVNKMLEEEKDFFLGTCTNLRMVEIKPFLKLRTENLGNHQF